MAVNPLYMSMTSKLLEIAATLPDKYDGTKFDGGTIKKSGIYLNKLGSIVAIRSVHDKHGDETFIGVLVGEWFNDDPGSLHHEMGNPVIYAFKLKTFLRGFESWWGIIPRDAIEGKSCDDVLKKYRITGDTINAAVVQYMTTAVVFAKAASDAMHDKSMN